MKNIINKFTIISGVNGSGKTTFALDYFSDSNTIFINADSIATSLSPNNPDLSQFRAGKLMIGEIKNCIKNKQNFAIETTLSSKNYLKIIKNLKKQNWQINLIYLYLPSVDLSIKRVTERVKNGGHNIKKADILRRYDRSIDNLINSYFDFVDNIICIDNQDTRELIFNKNSKLNIYNQEKYNKIMEFKNA
jgi:predicted ABC-type ATPase